MKKTILFALIVVGLVGSLSVGSLVSQVRSAAQKAKIRAQEQSATAEVLRAIEEGRTARVSQSEPVFQNSEQVFRPEPVFRDVEDNKIQRLRNEVLQMIQQQLKTMNEEELTGKKAELQKELGEHQAKAELEHAKKLLKKIAKTYPKSEAAKEARKMLGQPEVIFEKEARFEGFEPIPSQFQRKSSRSGQFRKPGLPEEE